MKEKMYLSFHDRSKMIVLSKINAIIKNKNYHTVDFHMDGGSIITLPFEEFKLIEEYIHEIWDIC